MTTEKWYIFSINTINYQKSLQQFNQVIIMMEQNMVVIRDPKTFCFRFEWPKDVDENLKDETEFIINSNKSVAENKIKKRD